MIDEGAGPPLIVIPGLQGRWEWMLPAVRELARTCRTISYSLCGERGSGFALDPSLGFESHVRQLDAVYAAAGLERAALCGVSYGGFIALRYAALHPERVSALILVSAPAPGWVPSDRQQRYLARPRLLAPLFVLSAPARLWPEVKAAMPSWGERMRFGVTHGARVLAAPLVPARAAVRISMQQAADFTGDAARVTAPVLVITGEDHLDGVVPPSVTRWYLSMFREASYEKLERTGHIGMITRPGRFARLVSDFVHANDH